MECFQELIVKTYIWLTPREEDQYELPLASAVILNSVLI